jgi:hypothetical protein
MTKDEQFHKSLAEIQPQELIDKAHDMISELAKSGGKSFRMCIPPSRFDTDMLLSEVVRRYESSLRVAESNTWVKPTAEEHLFNMGIEIDEDGLCKESVIELLNSFAAIQVSESKRNEWINPKVALPQVNTIVIGYWKQYDAVYLAIWNGEWWHEVENKNVAFQVHPTDWKIFDATPPTK